MQCDVLKAIPEIGFTMCYALTVNPAAASQPPRYCAALL